MAVGKVFSVEEFSVHDGPGVRMTVFLKGCRMRCNWCHNPEGQRFEKEITKNINGCTGCGRCLDAGERASGQRKLTAESIAVCPHHLLRVCGKEYTAEQLAELILKKKFFFRDGGGVTFSGGEPLAQAEFLLECLTLLEGKAHRALQTSGFCDEQTFRRVLRQVDYVLYDLKLMDEEKSREYTGEGNRAILRNFDILAESGVPYVVRVPLIPTVTDTEENLRAIAAYMAARGARRAELLPYHKLSGSKYAMAGRTYAPKFDESVPVSPRLHLFEEKGISAEVL